MRIKNTTVFVTKQGERLDNIQILEAYERSENLQTFIKRIGDERVENIFESIAKQETENRKLFLSLESGKSIPNHISKQSGSLRYIRESSENFESFTGSVVEKYGELSETDISNLRNIYELNEGKEINTSLDKLLSDKFGSDWANTNGTIKIDGVTKPVSDVAKYWRKGVIATEYDNKFTFNLEGYDIEIKK